MLVMHDIHYKPLGGSDNIWSSICWLITRLQEANNPHLFFLFSESEDEDMTNVPENSLQSSEDPDFYACQKISQPVPFYTAPMGNKPVGSHFGWSKTGLWKGYQIIRTSIGDNSSKKRQIGPVKSEQGKHSALICISFFKSNTETVDPLSFGPASLPLLEFPSGNTPSLWASVHPVFVLALVFSETHLL